MKRKHFFVLLLFYLVPFIGQAQQPFWQENFSANNLPEGWKSTDDSGTGRCQWKVTDQPYPGSFQFNQQQPPIASTSRGYHLQYQAGVITGDEATKWRTEGKYPNSSVQTNAIDCSGHDKIVLRFEHNFRWNHWFATKESGLFVGVSNDGKTWKEFNVKDRLAAATSLHKPLKEEIDITNVAAQQKTVYLRFAWRGLYSWFWMIDDISLGEPLQQDISLTALTSHQVQGNHFTEKDTLRVKVKNLGAKTIQKDLTLTAQIDGKRTLQATLKASTQPLAFNESREIAFPPVSLKELGSHHLNFNITYAGDERPANNTLNTKLYASQIKLGKITGYQRLAPDTYEFESRFSKAKLIFYSDDIFRLWVAPDGEYTNPAANDIVVDYSSKHPKVKVSKQKEYYRFTTRKCVVRIYKDPMRIALYSRDNKQMLFEESAPLVFGEKTTQTLLRDAKEHLYGGGMQQGSIDHAGKDIDISVTGWKDGEVSNPVPFYLSNKGYGVFRNTFKPGKYAFSGSQESERKLEGLTVKVKTGMSQLTHHENRFDAFYFYGPSMKEVLNRYTDITGKPFMPAVWMLTMGDADCYNNLEQRVKWEQRTPDVITQIADEYIKHDMPRGWILPNDGYGCGYQKLDSVVTELKKRGFHTGLWTENGVDKIAYEVGECGTRLCKLDVAWIGEGYDFALNGCKSAYQGIQQNSNERGFVWSVCGWAGTQRYSTVWSGDQVGDWNYIRYHIPTLAGAGMSAFNAATSDIDGIFGGSAPTYTRDLQWKCFTPIMMVMSGWANVDRQPWLYGHPYESINRDFLRLKMRLLPYLYSYCHEAHVTGVPTVRPMALEFPKDEIALGEKSKYQFMSGEWLMVAPIYTRGNKRKDIYFPEGTWYDFWDDTAYTGGQWLKQYEARLDKCPVFVRQGAILPEWQDMNYVGEKPTNVLTLRIWPSAHSSFTLYEDDGVTRNFEKGAYATTKIEVMQVKGKTKVIVHPLKGNFKEAPKERTITFDLYLDKRPKQVLLNGSPVDFSYGKQRLSHLRVKGKQLSTKDKIVLVVD